ncbi:MAG: hypothetical protein JSU70_00210 [Phycisphaerales bacterium]|nr:MAG: hypothetical protein JSU70_00210 [Phycisphaerales bacterium]
MRIPLPFTDKPLIPPTLVGRPFQVSHVSAVNDCIDDSAIARALGIFETDTLERSVDTRSFAVATRDVFGKLETRGRAAVRVSCITDLGGIDAAYDDLVFDGQSLGEPVWAGEEIEAPTPLATTAA